MPVEELGPIDGTNRHQVRKMIELQITQYADHFRMVQYWRRLLAGENDVEEIVQGICMALSGGRYIEKPHPRPGVTLHLTVNVNGAADAEQVGAAIGKAIHTVIA